MVTDVKLAGIIEATFAVEVDIALKEHCTEALLCCPFQTIIQKHLAIALALEFGSDAYRVGSFVAYQSMDSLYRNLYSEVSVARTWMKFAVGMSYGLDMEWVPGDAFWTRHRFKGGVDYRWKQIAVAAMLSGFTDEGVSHISPVVGVHWKSDESVSTFAECDFDYLYVGASFRWKFLEVGTSYRFPDFAVAVLLSFNGSRYGVSYARGFKHNSLGWNGVHVSRWLKQ